MALKYVSSLEFRIPALKFDNVLMAGFAVLFVKTWLQGVQA